MSCPFCNFNNDDISNTIIEQTQNFLILPSKGALCDGYLLIVPKQHLNSMNELDNKQKEELNIIIEKYQKKFFEIYNKSPIFFEHGSSQTQIMSASSVTHAHMHIVNHNFSNQNQIISELNFQKVDKKIFFKNQNKNYISYISPNGEYYISYNFKPVSQQMRIYIARDLNLTDCYNWKTFGFENNIIETIKNFS